MLLGDYWFIALSFVQQFGSISWAFSSNSKSNQTNVVNQVKRLKLSWAHMSEIRHGSINFKAIMSVTLEGYLSALIMKSNEIHKLFE